MPEETEAQSLRRSDRKDRRQRQDIADDGPSDGMTELWLGPEEKEGVEHFEVGCAVHRETDDDGNIVGGGFDSDCRACSVSWDSTYEHIKARGLV